MITRFVGCILKGLESELPATAPYFADHIFISTDTGSMFNNDGTGWTQLSGSSKSEEQKNKILASANNTFINLVQDPFTSQKREGFFTPALSPDGSLKYALKGWPYNGTYSYQTSVSEGFKGSFTTNVVDTIGYFSTPSAGILTKTSLLPDLKARVRTDTIVNTRFYLGYSSNLTLPNSNIPFTTADYGLFVGFDSMRSNYTVYSNDGNGTMATPTSLATPKDTNFHTFEIIVSTTAGITIVIDDVDSINISSKIPALAANVYLFCMLQNTATQTVNFDISKIRFNSNLS